jgi:hypothetical protein
MKGPFQSFPSFFASLESVIIFTSIERPKALILFEGGSKDKRPELLLAPLTPVNLKTIGQPAKYLRCLSASSSSMPNLPD